MRITGHHRRGQEYGYLSYLHHVVLGLNEVDCLVHPARHTWSHDPLSFFPVMGPNANSSGIRRLIQIFFRTCVSFPAPWVDRAWYDEARFATPTELAMCLR